MKDQERSNVANPPDYQFQHADTEPHTEPQRSLGPLIAAAVLVMLAAAGAYWMFGRHRATAPATPTPPPPTAVAIEPARPLGADAAPVDVPPLGESDAVVRTLVRALSTHPVVAAWLTTTGLIRNFTAAVSNIADDSTPAKQLVALRPAAVFTITSRGGKSYIDPQSYSRYNRVADALASVDPAGAARLYTTLKPRIEEAAGELGHPPGTFDRVLEHARRG